MKSALIPKALPIFLTLLLSSSCSHSQDFSSSRLAGGPCEGCEGIFEFGDKTLTPVDTLPGFSDASQKLKITGTIYGPDGKTPAENVILYIYHTDESGRYATRGDEKGWARRHGYIRGWIKTGADGKYTFFTQMPGTYPDRSEPAHIHPTILEPKGQYYYIEEYRFEGDPLLKKNGPQTKTPRGGAAAVIRLQREGDLLYGRRDIILGKNIPHYEKE